MTDSLQAKLEALGEIAARLPVPGAESRPLGEREFRWGEIDRQLGGRVSGSRVLVVGSEVGDDAVAFARRGAAYVLAFAAPGAAERSTGSNGNGPTGVDFQEGPWQELDPSRHDRFDIVHCHGLLHRVTDPLGLLSVLRSLSVPAGTLLISSMMISDPERSEYLRFVPDRYAGDPTWRFIPGRLAFRWIVQTAGFDVQAEFAEREGPRDLLPVCSAYLRAVAVG